jgi:hypothetical protein
MGSWYKAVLSSQEVVAGEVIALVNDFEYAYSDSGQPKGMALFQGETVPAGSTVYFSPGTVVPASHLIASYSGTECATPRKDELRFLSGDMSVLDSLE